MNGGNESSFDGGGIEKTVGQGSGEEQQQTALRGEPGQKHHLNAVLDSEDDGNNNSMPTAHDDDHNKLAMTSSIGDISMLSFEGDDNEGDTSPTSSGVLSSLIPQSLKGQCLCLFVTTLILFGCLTIAGVCGAGLCNNTAPNLQDSGENKEPFVDSAPPWLLQTPSPTSSPTVSRMPSSAPITLPRKAFESAPELYQAVDEYLATGRANDTDYGHPIAVWDVSLLEDFTSVFDYNRNPLAASFDENLLWATSRATKMKWMFRKAAQFNGNLAAFDTSRVTTMENMFQDCTRFQGRGLEQWDTGNVVSFREMLARCPRFRADLSMWNTSSATNMNGMFRLNTDFNSHLGGWVTSKVKDMSYLFLNCFEFEGRGLENWDTRNVQSMALTFANAPSFNGDLRSWNVTSVTDMTQMFSKATAFTSDLSRWRPLRVKIMRQIFEHAVSFSADISKWETASLRDASAAFFGATLFKTDVSNWNVTGLFDATKMFAGARCTEHDYCAWGQQLPRNASTRSMFLASGCDNKADPDPNDIARGPFCVTCVATTTESPTASPSAGAAPADLPPYQVATLEELYVAVDLYLAGFLGGIRSWDVSLVTSFESVFDVERNPAAATFDEDLEWNTSSATTMHRMFYGAANFDGEIASFNTSSVMNMSSMFERADTFNQDVGSFEVSNVVDISYMFKSALSFQGKGLSNWNVSEVKTVSGLFEEAISLITNVGIGEWDVRKVVDFSHLFQYASCFNDDISGWRTISAETFQYAFHGAATFNRQISDWPVGNVRNFIGMFSGAKAFNRNLCNWAPQLHGSADDIVLRGMFVSSACLNTEDPDPDNPANGPYCRVCTT